MNFSNILDDVSHGNFSSVVELNNFKQVDKEHIMEIYSRDVRSASEKSSWIRDIEEEEWKPEVVNLLKEVYYNCAPKPKRSNKFDDEDVLNPLNASKDLNDEDIYQYVEEPKSKPRSKLLSMKQSGYDLFNPFDMDNDVPNIAEPVFKTLPPLLRGTTDSAGHDITSLVDVTIPAHGFASVETGVRYSIPSGYHIDVRARSGLGFRNQLVAFNGLLDSDYSSINPDDPQSVNTIKVGMFNFSNSDYTIKAGDRIAQLVICKDHYFNNSVVGDSSSHDGFGSTGK